MTDREYLYQVADILKRTQVEGNKEDDPEGTGYIRISKTLANEISMRLMIIAEKVKT